MTARDLSRRWDNGRRRFREQVARHMPEALTFYPFEVVTGLLALVIGIPLILGIAASASLVLALPHAIYWVYSVALVLGGGTILAGLRLKSATVLVSGLRLVGGSFLVYAAAVIILVGWAGAIAPAAAFAVMGVVCFIRAHHFRRLMDIQVGATRPVGP